jgi:hydroxyacylglutathione hydrolase
VQQYIDAAEAQNLRITHVTETHIHADFLSGARELARRTGASLCLSDEGDANWKYRFPHDRKLKDGDRITIGNVTVDVLHTPGHTPEHVTFVITDGAVADQPIAAVTGDFVFVGDVGRPDLLERAANQAGTAASSAHELWDSLRWFDRLDDYLQVWPGHGAGSACGKTLGDLPSSTVGYEKRYNRSLAAATSFTNTILDGQVDPPSYFARMKRENRDGVALLGELPQPQRVEAAKIAAEVAAGTAVLLDTRSWNDFRRAHLRGSYYTPFDNSFPTLAGSYVTPEQTVYLLIDAAQINEAVRCLVRVGIDKIAGVITADDLTRHLASKGGEQNEIRATNAEGLAGTIRQKGGVTVLDVRSAPEYAESHVQGALQLAHTRLRDGIDTLPANETIYVHCGSGARAAAAAAYLQAHGRNVVYVGGNIADFAGAGVPMEDEKTAVTA